MEAKNKARVAYVVKRYPRYSETFILNEILAHEKAGMALDIIALRPPVDTHFQAALARVKAPVTYLKLKGKMRDLWKGLQSLAELPGNRIEKIDELWEEDCNDLYQGIQLAQIVLERGLKHLHAHFATSATDVARIAAKLAGITYSFTAHAKDIYHESVDMLKLTRKMEEAASIITVSDFNKQFLDEHYGIVARKVKRLYNGLVLEDFQYHNPVGRPPLIAAVGRLVEKKGFDILIKACALLKQKGRSFTCRIAGAGELHDELQALIEGLAVQDVVALVGPLPLPEVATLMQESALFAAPCVVAHDGNRDGLPTVLLEAMSLGATCISTDVTGIKEAVKHGETGVLVQQRDPSALAAAIELLLDDEALRVGLAEEARRLIEDQFDVDRNAAILRTHFPLSEQNTPLSQQNTIAKQEVA